MGMKLYHFTSKHHIESCLARGLVMGVIPVSIDPVEVIPGYQWLTKNKRFQQSWCHPSYSSLPYRRDEYRIMVVIPKSQRKNVIPWLQYCEETKIESAADLNAFGDPHNWMLFKGKVRPEWFKKTHRNPHL